MPDAQNKKLAEFVCYGAAAVADVYGKGTFQIVAHENGREQSGTGFIATSNCILTAAHCVRSADRLQILGLSKTDLVDARIIVSKSPTLDCAAIVFPENILANHQLPIYANAEVLNEVILLGYPNIPTLLNVQLAEKANVATIIRGSVGGAAADIFRSDLLVITAPVRGGFSGGPVITTSGALVGMISRQPFPEIGSVELSQYDAAGFGLAIPFTEIQSFLEHVKNRNKDIIEPKNPTSWEWL